MNCSVTVQLCSIIFLRAFQPDKLYGDHTLCITTLDAQGSTILCQSVVELQPPYSSSSAAIA